MASSFPGAIDSFVDPLSTSPLSSPSHSAQHADLNDAVEKVETYVLDRPKGVVALTSNATTTLAGNYLTGSDTTFTFSAGRYYKISVSNLWNSTGNALLEIELGGTRVQRYFDNRFATRPASDQFFAATGFWVGTTTAGSKTVRIKYNQISGTLTNVAIADIPNQVVIEDVGAV